MAWWHKFSSFKSDVALTVAHLLSRFPMSSRHLERKISDAFTGLQIEETLNSKIDFAADGGISDNVDGAINANLSDELEMGDLNNISESSGIVSGLTSSVASCASSGTTIPSHGDMVTRYIDDFARDRDSLKSAMVRPLLTQ